MEYLIIKTCSNLIFEDELGQTIHIGNIFQGNHKIERNEILDLFDINEAEDQALINTYSQEIDELNQHIRKLEKELKKNEQNSTGKRIRRRKKQTGTGTKRKRKRKRKDKTEDKKSNTETRKRKRKRHSKRNC